MPINHPLFPVKVIALLFSFLIVSLTSIGQVGLIGGWVGSKVNDKAAWNKFKKELSVSDTVLYGDTLFCLRTSAEGLNQLAGSNKYRVLSAAIRSLESHLNETREYVLEGKPIEKKRLSHTDAMIEQVIKEDKKFDVEYYRKEQTFYSRYQDNYASRQQAMADSVAMAKQRARQAGSENAPQQPTNSTSQVTKHTNPSGPVIYGNLDSASVVTLYGSIAEYNEQYLFRRKSSHGHLVLFAGKNTGWLNELTGYLENKAWSVNNYGGVAGARKITMRGACFGCKENNWPRIDITMHYDTATNKIKKLVLTGKDMVIERLFVEYWDIADIKYDQLRGKGIFYYDLLTDKISLVSKPTGSTLSITANPKVSMPGK